MIGSYPPQKSPHEVTFPRIGWEECPSGTIQRGDYKAKSKVINHLKLCNQIIYKGFFGLLFAFDLSNPAVFF